MKYYGHTTLSPTTLLFQIEVTRSEWCSERMVLEHVVRRMGLDGFAQSLPMTEDYSTLNANISVTSSNGIYHEGNDSYLYLIVAKVEQE